MIVESRPYFSLILLCLALYLPGLAAVPALDRDEARFAQSTRQMLEAGDFIRIRFQDTSRHRKPAGIHWLQAAAVITLSDQATPAIWPYRLPSVTGALAAVLLTFYFGQVLFDRRTALLSATLLAGTLMLVMEAHQAKTDAVLLACVVAAQGALACLYCQTSPSPSPYSSPFPTLGTALTFWLAQGVGVMVKGPIVAVVSGLTIAGLWVWEQSRPYWLTGLQPIVGMPFIAALVVPWFTAISCATSGAFISEAVQIDLLPKILGAQESHGALPGYFLLLASLTFWPASLFLWPALAYAWRRRAVPAVRFCLAWIGPGWLLFETVPTKLPHYVLPIYPALALLVADALLARQGESYSLLASRRAYFWYGTWAILTTVLVSVFLAAPMVFSREANLWGALLAGALEATAWLAVWLAWRRQFLRAMATAVICGGIAFTLMFAVFIPSLDSLWLSRQVHALLSQEHAQAVIAAGYHEPSLVFMLGTDTILSDGRGAAISLIAMTSAVAVISREEDEAFQQALARYGLRSEQLFTVHGLNYSRGCRERLRIYRAVPVQ
ncbi:4-amino-4-deoxy-L-arabinose transferase and related glycosyltransferases of PMT family [invertebrate metagenome]|uniref:4-amino-4-deoxy-L-arabinose transferase and related glycosyltransferases of PMT family n=1 Tax=invertebrate metagenome TaxID=1711999 RepID=A0A484HCW7_9ZZZZ